MYRTYFLSLLAFLLVIAGLVSEEKRILILALPLVVFLLAGFWRAPGMLKLSAMRSLSAERVFSGEAVQVTLVIKNTGDDLEEVLLEDVLPERLEVVGGAKRYLTRLPRDGVATWTYTLQGKRGYFMLHEVRVTVREPLGLSTVNQILPTDGQLFIVPPVLRLRNVSIRPRRTRIFSGIVPAGQGGPGVEFFDVREYQTGDSPRAINWRQTARHPQSIYANQYEQERVVDVGLILDGRRQVIECGERSIFEHSVMATAAIVDAFLSAGNRVGLLFYGKELHWTMPGYGKVQSEKILHDLSRLEPGGPQIFNDLYIPRHLFPVRSQLVLVSPLTPNDFHALFDLRSKKYAVLVISPDPVAFEFAGLSATYEVDLARRIAHMQRQAFLRRLRGIGIQVVNWDVSQPFEQVARRELERRQPVQRGVF
ncbi:MAG: DUF58 domain-containing protein [Anaerolineales bacterium]